jgi:hypothetical protein
MENKIKIEIQKQTFTHSKNKKQSQRNKPLEQCGKKQVNN